MEDKVICEELLRADVCTEAGHVYSLETLKETAKKAKERLKSRNWFGKPDSSTDGSYKVSLLDISHKIEDIYMEDDALMARIELLNSPKGEALKEIMTRMKEYERETGKVGGRIIFRPEGTGKIANVEIDGKIMQEISEFEIESVFAECEAIPTFAGAIETLLRVKCKTIECFALDEGGQKR